MESLFEKKQERKFGFKFIETEYGKTLDIINGQGALLTENKTEIYDSNGKIKSFNEKYPVTSHGFLTCVEVIGELDNNNKFYIHSQNPFEMESLIKEIIGKSKIINLRIRGDFSRYLDEDENEKIDEYRRYLNDFNIENIDIQDEALVGFSEPEILF